MPSLSSTLPGGRPKNGGLGLPQISPEHYLRIILHRKWLIVSTFLVVTVITAIVVSQLPNIYTSETLILVESQKVPENYVRPTVTGDVRNRLNTLEQQILSATRLQTIIDTLKLYPEERKKLPREDVIMKMRRDVTISLVSDIARQDVLQAFKIAYSGREPRLVARVVNELAALFIDENLKAREEQATGTTEFLESQLEDTRKALESQESKLRDFRLKHIGEMPEQEAADLQILGHLQSELHLVGEALSRAEQQRSLTQAMMSQSAPIVNIDESTEDEGRHPLAESRDPKAAAQAGVPGNEKKARLLAQVKERLSRGYTESHPDIRKLRAQIAEEEAKEPKLAEVKPDATAADGATADSKEIAAEAPAETAPARKMVRPLPPTTNPVLITQMKGLDAEIAKQREEQQRLNKQIAAYQAKLEAIPVRQQEITELQRDYEISKAHYSQLLDKQLSAETATQLEIRQKGEKFKILDPAQPAERPSKPNRKMLDAAGALAGLGLGLILALATEFMGMSITAPEQVTEASGLPVLEVIPVIETHISRRRHRRQMVFATVSGTLFVVLAVCAAFFYRYRG